MVAAKQDQSRVLVTKFRQNRLALKGRSTGPRHTDRQTDVYTHTHTHTHRQTNLAENKGTSGFAIGPTDRLFAGLPCPTAEARRRYFYTVQVNKRCKFRRSTAYHSGDNERQSRLHRIW